MNHATKWSHLLRLGFVVLALALAATGAWAATVQVSPADTTVTLGDTVTVRVVVDAFPDLKAYQLIYGYCHRLQYLGPIAGDVLTGSGQPYVMNSLADVTAPGDTAWVDCAQLMTSTGGPGVLVYFRFVAMATGDCPIECLSVDLRNSHNDPTIPTCHGGVVRIVPPVAALPTTWGRVKSIYR